jgi:chemosensory pili system protein ChpA (sensor histidine kinase/response regulator)
VECDEPPGAAIVIERREQHVALLVGALGAMRETMVRPLPTYLKRKLIRGVTIRSEDGAIALLIDVGELVDQLLAGAVTPPHPAPVRVARPQPVARVMIVDDSVTIRRTLDQMLTRAGFSTALARDGYEALEMMENELPRVIILDVEMPRLNGYELLGIMRSSPKYDRTRVAMLTSRAGTTHERHARDLGADEYLVKPCPQDTLISAVRRLLTDSEPS